MRDPRSAAVLPARVVGFDEEDGLAELDLGGQSVFVDGSGKREIGTLRRLRIEASDVSLTRETPGLSTILNRLDVTIRRIEPAATPANLAVLLSLVGCRRAYLRRPRQPNVRRGGWP